MVLATTRQNCNKMQKHNKRVAVMSIMVPKENKFGKEKKSLATTAYPNIMNRNN
jgi:hypothetical protein